MHYRQSNSSGNSKHACMQLKYVLVVVQHNARLEQIMLKQTMAAAWHNQIIMWENNWIWFTLDHSKECASSVHSQKNEWIDIDLLHCTIQGEQTSSRHQSYLVYVKKGVTGSKSPYQKQMLQALLEGALAPPYGILATAVFHVISCAKALTSSGSTWILS